MVGTTTPPIDVAIVGAGLAGLCCARGLVAGGRSVVVLEAADAVGGRVRTDLVDGYRIDRGFQVLLTAYPEAQASLDAARLDLRPFYPGALVRHGGSFHRVADPWRRPLHGLLGALGPVGSLADKLRVGRMRIEAMAADPDRIAARPETTTRAALAARGFSDAMVEAFFRPFLGGVFLEGELRTSSRMLDFVWKMFSSGDIAVPALGMEQIPLQLAADLPAGSVRTGVRASAVAPGEIRLDDGSAIAARAVVVATEGPAAARLLGEPGGDPGSRTVTCHSFAAPRSPLDEAILVLNGDGAGDGPVNNMHVASDVSPACAPPGRALVSATVLAGGSPEPEAALAQLRRWFGPEVDGWRLLRTCRIEHALPERATPRPPRLRDGLWVCGDWCEQASIQGAMLSGRRTAEAILAA